MPRFSFSSSSDRPLVLAGLFTLATLLLFPQPAHANIPGGGTGTGANVTLTTTGTTATLSNGIISILCTKSSGNLNQISYTFNNGSGNQTLQVLSGGKDGGMLYWDTGGFGTGSFAYSTVVDPALGDAHHAKGDYGEIDLFLNSPTNGTMDVHFSMLRGSSGFYITAIWSHRASDVAMGTGDERENIYFAPYFNWETVDSLHNREFDPTATQVPAFFAPQEVSLTTSGILKGKYDDKYKDCADFGVERVWGWSSVIDTANGFNSGKNIGIWHILASAESFNGGPLKPELMDAPMLNVFNGGHYQMGVDSNYGAGEVWTRVSGPYFIYFNNTSIATTNPVQASGALFADAQAQAAAEATAWPYSWFVNGNYSSAAQRGNVTGKFVIADPYNPNASAANLWVGVEQQPITIDGVYDFQEWEKPYEFWVKTDANGNFTIPNVIAGANYTLYAFGPGAAGTFMSQNQAGGNPVLFYDLPATPFSVTVTGGNTTSLGNVTWIPGRVGPTVWEIGYPDRKSDKFRHGDDWWVGDIGPSPSQPSPIWTKFLEYPFDFPNGPHYTVGQSRWSTDWNFIQPIVVDSQGNDDPSNSTITFNLASAPAGGATASLYIGTASDDAGPLIVTLNGHNLGSTSGVTSAPTTNSVNGYSPYNSSSDANIREENHAAFSDERITFPATLLQQGSNTLNINMRRGGSEFGHAMYDYIRLELTGYVPPAPAGVTAYANNNANLVTWPAVPGATSYNLLRSITSGSGYALLAGNVTGPVCGSGPANATYVDNTAANGTPYYYVVQSVNPVGTSANSPQSAGIAPSSGASTSAPATPTGLVVSSVGNATVNLSWTAVAGANTYTVQRGTVVNLLGSVPFYVVLSNTITGTTYTDTTPTNGSQYSYIVTATNAFGTSANSTAVVAKPLPTAPATAPASLTVTPGAAQNTLSWTAVPGAVGYIIQRSTSLGGAYSYVMSVSTTSYTDKSSLSNNTAYYYTVTAMNAGGASVNSTIVTTQTAPSPPVITALGGTGNVTLSWGAVTGAANYTIQRSTTTGTETTIASGVTGTTYTNTGLTSGTTYFYVVDAVNSSNAASTDSNEAAVTPLAIPTGLTAAGHTGNVTLSWTAVTNAGNYTVHRGTATGGPYSTTVGTTTTANLTDATTVNGTPYYYVVSAANTTTDAASALVSPSLSANSTEVTATPLAAPTGVSALGSNGNATLTWTATPGATSYTIYRSTINGSGFASVNSTVTAPPYTDPGLTNGTTYFYLVAAKTPNSLSNNSTQVSAVPLSPPLNFAAAGGSANVTLTWTASAGATSYVVRRGTVPGGPYTLLTSGATGTTYPDNGLTNGTTYYYIIAAAATGGLSGNATEASATPLAPPANLTATPGTGNITLAWTGTPGATAYTLKRSTSSGAETTLATGLTGTTYKDLTAANGTKYYYTVTATAPNSAGASSPETSATPQAPAPAAPADLAATPGNGNVTLTWSPVAGAATYTLSRATTPGAEAPLAAGLATGPYLDADVTNGTVYYYILTATNPGGTSPNSPEVTATPAATLTQWAGAAFGNSTDANLTGPAANPAGDGIPNLLKYFYGLDPATNSGAPPVSTTPDTSGNLLITFHLSKNTAGLTYQIQSSPDLTTWTNTGIQGTVLSDQGAYYLMQAAIPLNANPHLYLRIKVIGQ